MAAESTSTSMTPFAQALSPAAPPPSSSPRLHIGRRMLDGRGVPMTDLETRVLVIYTGGTIGMVRDKDGVLVPKADALLKYLREQPIFHDKDYAQKTDLVGRYGDKTLVLPKVNKDSCRIVYTILEYDPLLDSSNMTPDDWCKIGKDIEGKYRDYNGFVILHGTDTMAYTASALSFMCEHLGKLIIVTGSQVPIYDLRTDGRDNLLNSLILTGLYVIPEVCLYFYNKLYRGNRTTKTDADSFEGFSSPNLPPLASAEVDISINWALVRREETPSEFRVSTALNSNVGLLRLFPGITTSTVKAFLQKPMQGVVLETYGAGNAPDKNLDLLAELKKATDAGVIIVNCTQCLRGTVSMTYATGKALVDAGVISGRDMTPEAALSKLSYVLAKEDKSVNRKKLMEENLRGEMTVDVPKPKVCVCDVPFFRAIAEPLSLSCKQEVEAVREALTPTLSCAAAKTGDVEALKALKDMGSTLCQADYHGRTPLHVASCEGHLPAVEYLLSQGASVHMRDRSGDTPLTDGVRFRHKEVVKLLRKSGAHLSKDELQEAGAELCSLAARGDRDRLEILFLAGADLDKPGCDGQTAAQVAKAGGKADVATFIQNLQGKKT